MTYFKKKQRVQAEEFTRLGTTKRSSFWSDYFFFLKTNKKWWMLPLIVLLLCYGFVMVLTSSGALAPFIYTLF